MAKKREVLIRAGRVIDPASRRDGRADVLFKDGRVAAVGPRIWSSLSERAKENFDVVDAAGCWIVPGLVDMHVHLREPGQTENETIATGTEAAARGGVTTVLTLANTKPAIDTPSWVKEIRARAKRHGLVNVLVAGAVTKGLKGEELTDLRALARAGAAAFSDDGRPVMNAELMRRALLIARETGIPLLDHAEDLALTADGALNEGPAARRHGVAGIPALSEAVMTLRDAALAEALDAPLHLCHVSCAQAVGIVRQAKARGAKITAEAAPHHFTLSHDDIPAHVCGQVRPTDYKMKPPLRSKADRKAVREGLADGTLDAVATDHAPHAAAYKRRSMDKAPFGVIGLETTIPLTLELVRAGLLSPSAFVDKVSAAPARILGLKSKGRLSKGADADATVIAPKARWSLAGGSASKSRNTPFLNAPLIGRAKCTVVAGRIVYDRLEAP